MKMRTLSFCTNTKRKHSWIEASIDRNLTVNY